MDGKNFFLWLTGLTLCILPVAVGNKWPLWIYLTITFVLVIIDFVKFYRQERKKEKEQEQQMEWEKRFEAAEGELESGKKEAKLEENDESESEKIEL